MAPTESANSFEGPSREELEKGLVGVDAKDLCAMAERLTRSLKDMQECYDECIQDSSTVTQENSQLHATIDMMIKEMKKLNISSANTVEPTLDEGPLDFVGRFWDKVRPRDNVIVVNEHVGELKKAPQATFADGTPVELPNPVLEKLTTIPVVQAGMDRVSDAAQALEPLRQSGHEALQTSSETLESLRQSGSEAMEKLKEQSEALRNQSGEELLGTIRNSSSEALQSGTDKFETLKKSGTDQFEKLRSQSSEEVLDTLVQSSTERLASFRQSSNEALKSTSETLGSIWNAGTVSSWFGDFSYTREEQQPDSGDASCQQANGETISDAASTTLSESSELSSVSAATAEANPCPSAPAPVSTASVPESAPAVPAQVEENKEETEEMQEEQINATIIIEASLKLDDGSIVPLQMRAVDRCKEVAARFVREHSLKAWFEEPLTAYLKQVENDAEEFPVKVEADLLEIRKTYSKSDRRQSTS